MTKARLVPVALGGLILAAVLTWVVLPRGNDVAAPNMQRQLASGDTAPALNPEDVPEFFASDPLLEKQSAHVTRERAMEGPANEGSVGVPFFVEFADGRYAVGRTDSSGLTRPLFTDGLVAHKTTWGDDAVVKWRKKSRERESGAANEIAAVEPVGPRERWRQTAEAATPSSDVRVGTPERARTPAELAATTRARTPAELAATTPGVNARPCTIAVTGDSPVAKACVLGGLALAKREMKELVQVARANGERFGCESCHKNLDSYELVNDARETFKTLLRAAPISSSPAF